MRGRRAGGEETPGSGEEGCLAGREGVPTEASRDCQAGKARAPAQRGQAASPPRAWGPRGAGRSPAPPGTPARSAAARSLLCSRFGPAPAPLQPEAGEAQGASAKSEQLNNELGIRAGSVAPSV